ncbi:hypothetical protein OG552_15085 [Streptomyces sp. NBC_01476]|uniref:hypothetical protein n=1 Tax=Streptomyces sp. NBC_01476 TaxID=2903881 RepID=UPI002E36247D|nr:hypothetical protein [Streptomyces sp. NBC_01476]
MANDCPVHTPDGSTCSLENLAGGRLMILKTYEYPDHRNSLKEWFATFVTPSGAQIAVDEYNSAAEKGKPVTRTDPPLSAAQLKSLITSPKWQHVLDGLQPPVKSPKDLSADRVDAG